MAAALALILSLALAQQQRVAPAAQPTADQPTPADLAGGRSSTEAPRVRIDKRRRVQPAQAGVVLPADSMSVTLPSASEGLLGSAMKSGRVLLFFRAVDSLAEGDPIMAPFFEDPQPIASVQVDALQPGVPIEFGSASIWWPGGPELFDGEYEVQALFDCDGLGRGHLAAGNLISKPVRVAFSRGSSESVAIELSQPIPPASLPKVAQVNWIEMPSPLLSAAAGRPVIHQAAVLFPLGYHDIRASRRFWPTIYVVPGFGGKFTDATAFASKVGNPALAELWPQAVYVILDPETAFGHHAFVDSAMNGPRGSALITELIPYLEDRFRLVRDPSARLVTGHSSGGWASVWLALNHPNTFGAAFASSPDPLDFSAFQMSDLYRDTTLFTTLDGTPQPSFRSEIGVKHDLVCMSVADEVGMEHAISPRGVSGQQWDSWAAAFSPCVGGASEPRRICNPLTGEIDPVTVEAWSQFDISRRIRSDWNGMGRLFAERVRVIVGERDSFYLERAAIRLRESIDAHIRDESRVGREFPMGPGYIAIIPGATHDGVYQPAQVRFHNEMRQYLREGGHHD